MKQICKKSRELLKNYEVSSSKLEVATRLGKKMTSFMLDAGATLMCFCNEKCKTWKQKSKRQVEEP